MKKYLILLVLFILFSCERKLDNEVLQTVPNRNLDTIMGYEPKGYKIYSKKSLTIPIISFIFPEPHINATNINAYDFPKKDSVYTVQCELVGFTNKEKTYPLKIKSDGVEIIKRDSIKKTYTFRFIKDVAMVTCYVEGQYHNFIYCKKNIYWTKKLGNDRFYLMDKELEIGDVKLTAKK